MIGPKKIHFIHDFDTACDPVSAKALNTNKATNQSIVECDAAGAFVVTRKL